VISIEIDRGEIEELAKRKLREEAERRAIKDIEKLPEFTFELSGEAIDRIEQKRDEILNDFRRKGIDIPWSVVEFAVLEALRRDLESEDFKPQISESADALIVLAEWGWKEEVKKIVER